jgi:hypothetical protein
VLQDLEWKEEQAEFDNFYQAAMEKLHFVSTICRQPVAAELQSYIVQYCCSAVAQLGTDCVAGHLPRASAYEAARYGHPAVAKPLVLASDLALMAYLGIYSATCLCPNLTHQS